MVRVIDRIDLPESQLFITFCVVGRHYTDRYFCRCRFLNNIGIFFRGLHFRSLINPPLIRGGLEIVSRRCCFVGVNRRLRNDPNEL